MIDESGRYVDGLTAEDFRVIENGHEQKISFFSHDSQIPISLGVLIDTSGSLQDKLHQGLQTLRGIAATLSSADEMFVITFDSHVNLKQRFTSDPAEISNRCATSMPTARPQSTMPSRRACAKCKPQNMEAYFTAGHRWVRQQKPDYCRTG